MSPRRLIETDRFPFEFLSSLAERESWRKEVHRPIYHVHKWWAKRLGSVFRGLALGSVLDEHQDLAEAFYRPHDVSGVVVFDPFVGSGTTVGEAHKLGLTALGRDINPVAVEAVRVALSALDPRELQEAFASLARGVGQSIRRLYEAEDSHGRPCEVLYYFWVMQADCPGCHGSVDLIPSWVRARNAYPRRKPEVQVLCPECANWFEALYTDSEVQCTACRLRFDPTDGTARGAKATCRSCRTVFSIREVVVPQEGGPPRFRPYGKLVLTEEGRKEYLATTEADHEAYEACSAQLRNELKRPGFALPTLELRDGHNTRQAMGYGFRSWRDFFNDRQLLALGWLHEAIAGLLPGASRDALLTLFSGVLEFNNRFASYKGEGTGAVRHLFAHHILKPERTPIEANLWGTPKSSGSFAGLFRSRLLRAAQYQRAPTELNGSRNGRGGVVCSPPFSGSLRPWRQDGVYEPRATYLSCGDSARTELATGSVDLVLTDPPFFDNVHYSELADFFFAWQQLAPRGFIQGERSTRAVAEVQDTDAHRFSSKLKAVFREAHRVLKEDGLLVFTYHHSREEGWRAVAEATLGAGFRVVNSHPLKSEMSVATPKARTREPIQLDIALVCRKHGFASASPPSSEEAIVAAQEKIHRLESAEFTLSRNDRMVIIFGQLLTTFATEAALAEIPQVAERVQQALEEPVRQRSSSEEQEIVRARPVELAVQRSLFPDRGR